MVGATCKEYSMPTFKHISHSLVFAIGTALASAAAAQTATPGAAADAQARYKQEMALCTSGQSSQDRATCQREARSALAAARRGALTTPADQALANAMQRCHAFPAGDDRRACESRVRGEGTVQGSVAGGGILRETVTVVPAK